VVFLPPDVALVIAQAASFLVLNSALCKMSIRTGKILASITAWICSRFPAVMFEIVQQASFRILSLLAPSKFKRQGKTEQFKMTWVWTSSPVTMLPTALKAADTTLGWGFIKSSTSLRHTPESADFTKKITV